MSNRPGQHWPSFLRIAHRGASEVAPENTLASFEAALRLGTEMIETDVRATRDGYLVLAHDDHVVTKNGQHIKISSTDVQEVRSAQLHGGEYIPLLDDALDLCYQRCLINLDLKIDSHAGRLYEAIVRHNMSEATLVTGAAALSFRALKAADPRIVTALSIDWGRRGRLQAALERLSPVLAEQRAPWLIDQAYKAGADYLALNQHMVSAALVSALRQRGVLVYVWTVDHPADMERLFSWEVAGIASNRLATLSHVCGFTDLVAAR